MVPARGGLEVRFWSLEPTPADRHARLFVYTSTDEDVAETVRIQQAETKDGITLALLELHPQTIVSAQHRFRTFAARLLGTELQELFSTAEAAYRGKGYR